MIVKYNKKVDKPWGYEMILTPSEAPAIAKILHLNKGCRFSLQYHEQKAETLILINGGANIYFGGTKENITKEEMVPNYGYFIKPGIIHRCEAITDCDIFEASTKEEGITFRLEDDYKRRNETKEDRLNRRI